MDVDLQTAQINVKSAEVDLKSGRLSLATARKTLANLVGLDSTRSSSQGRSRRAPGLGPEPAGGCRDRSRQEGGAQAAERKSKGRGNIARSHQGSDIAYVEPDRHQLLAQRHPAGPQPECDDDRPGWESQLPSSTPARRRTRKSRTATRPACTTSRTINIAVASRWRSRTTTSRSNCRRRSSSWRG